MMHGPLSKCTLILPHSTTTTTTTTTMMMLPTSGALSISLLLLAVARSGHAFVSVPPHAIGLFHFLGVEDLSRHQDKQFQPSFHPSPQRRTSRSSQQLGSSSSSWSSSKGDPAEKKARVGDPVRAATGIRPSLHPVTINALASLLTERPSWTQTNETSTPLQVALAAGRVAAEALHRRRVTSEQDGMALTEAEESTVAGRIVGVAVRLDDLERLLRDRCAQVPWIAKYNDWDSFGVLPDESSKEKVNGRLQSDPLWTVSRAECLLAMYLHEVEAPELFRKNATVPGGSVVDFLDSDRREVLLLPEGDN